MKRSLILLAMLSLSSLALAQQTGTRTQTVIDLSGNRVVGVQQEQVPLREAFPTFAEADLNGDGCVNRQEAFNVGILNFAKFARNGCLNEQQYIAAAQAPNFGR